MAIRRPSTVCSEPGCPALAQQGRAYCMEHLRRHVAMREHPALRRQQFYRSPEWREFRQQALELLPPVCAACGRTDVAIELDHIIPVRRRPDLALELGNIQGLCKSCHSRKTAAIDGGYGNQRAGDKGMLN
jgi:5-methylcytosine-specific restriction protein A